MEYKTLVKLKGKWFLVPEDKEADLPPDQLYSKNKTGYFNQGRKRITTEQTHHEDVLPNTCRNSFNRISLYESTCSLAISIITIPTNGSIKNTIPKIGVT